MLLLVDNNIDHEFDFEIPYDRSIFTHKQLTNSDFVVKFIGYNKNNEELYIYIKNRKNGRKDIVHTWEEVMVFVKEKPVKLDDEFWENLDKINKTPSLKERLLKYKKNKQLTQAGQGR